MLNICHARGGVSHGKGDTSASPAVVTILNARVWFSAANLSLKLFNL